MPRLSTYAKKRKQEIALIPDTPTTQSFQSRGFTVQAKAASNGQQEKGQKERSLASSLSRAERFGHHLSQVSVYSPSSTETPIVQRKRLKKDQESGSKLPIDEPQSKAEQEANQVSEEIVGNLSPADDDFKPSDTKSFDRLLPTSIQQNPIQRFTNPVIQRTRQRSNAVSEGSDPVRGRSNAVVDAPAQDIPQTRGRSNAFSADVTPLSQLTYDDFDGKQYRVTGSPPNRMIEEIKRTETNGKVTYFATGLVTNFMGNKPFVAPYPQPRNLGDWYPSVTHVNGMNVKPSSGLSSAEALHESVNQALNEGMNGNGVALGQDAVDVLYTYSAQRGEGLSGFVLDVWDCLKGKVGVKDQVTANQETIMLDAVHHQKRTTVSAHSRGTIKTDNAVRNVFKQLVQQYAPEAFADPAVDEAYQAGGEKAANKKAKEVAAQRAKSDMDKFIQLIYAGNAVVFPSSTIPAEMFVGGGDMVSFFVGSYSTFRAGNLGGDNTLNRVSGGHGFNQNYAKSVGSTIAQDIDQRRLQQVSPNLSNTMMEDLEQRGNRARRRR